MKNIKKIFVTALASLTLLAGCNIQPESSPQNRALNHDRGIVIVDDTEQRFNELVEAAKAETEAWYEANKASYEKFDPLEQDYYKYMHFKSVLIKSIDALPAETAQEINSYIKTNCLYSQFMYDRCFAIVKRIIDYKLYTLVPGAETPFADKIYESISKFLENSTKDEQHGFYLVMNISDEIMEPMRIAIKYSHLPLSAIALCAPVFCSAYVAAYNETSEADRQYIDLFTSKYSEFFSVAVFELQLD